MFAGAERCVRTEWADGTIGFFLAVFRRVQPSQGISRPKSESCPAADDSE